MENVVYIAAARDWFDYLATGATLLLSVIAVIIAVSTAKQQNKIALFDKRYSAFIAINNITLLKFFIDVNVNYSEFIETFNIIFCTNFSKEDKTRDALFEVSKHIKVISECAIQSVYLFDFLEKDDLANVCNDMGGLLAAFSDSTYAQKEYKDFKDSCEKFEEKYGRKIEQVLNINKSKASLINLTQLLDGCRYRKKQSVKR